MNYKHKEVKMKKKYYLIIILITILTAGIFSVHKVINDFYDKNVPILAYHVISDDPKSDMEVSTNNFKKQMQFLHDHHFHVMSMKELEDFKKSKDVIKGKKIVITFDDGDESYYTRALPIMEEYHFPSVNFVITSKIGLKNHLTKEQFDELKDNKLVELESHSNLLHHRDKAKSKEYDLYNDDLKSNKEYHFKYYAYPFGITNEEYVSALKDNDIHMAFKYAPSHWMNIDDDDYLLPRVPIYNSTSFFKFILKVLIKR